MEEEPGMVFEIVVTLISFSLSVLFVLIFWWVWKDVERILAELRSIHKPSVLKSPHQLPLSQNPTPHPVEHLSHLVN